MTGTFITPAQLDARQVQNKSLRAQEDERRASSMALQILDEAAAVGLGGVYLYNPTLGRGSEMFPEHIVYRAVRILNESGLWRAQAVRVRFWHPLLLMNMNHRLHSGTPVWRIHLQPVRKACAQ